MRRPFLFGAAVLVLCTLETSIYAQASTPQPYAGVVGGIAALSADGRSEIDARRANVSSYDPENGPALNLFAGLHLHDYVTLQANYIWNRNDARLNSVATSSAGASFYEQPRHVSQHGVIGDFLLYFRDLGSAIRPYLSVGVGLSRVRTEVRGATVVRDAEPPTGETRTTELMLRVAVGLDWSIGAGLSARYSFSEGISPNPISEQLAPPGQRSLMNFQNLFGLVWAR